MILNPAQILEAVAECIETRPPLDCKNWTICWHEDRLKCLPTRAVVKDKTAFLRISDEDCQNGLTLEQWSTLQRKIAEFFEEKSLCQDRPKP